MEKSETPKVTKHPLKVKGLSVLKIPYNKTGFYCKIVRDSDEAIIRNFTYHPLKGFKKFIDLFNKILDGIDWELANKDSLEHYHLANKLNDYIEKKDGYLQIIDNSEPIPEPKKEFEYFVFDESAIKNMHIKPWIKENCVRITHGYLDSILGDILCEKIVVEFPDFIRTLEACEKYDSFEDLKKTIKKPI